MLSERQVDRRVEKLRSRRPKMFARSQAREGEVCLGATGSVFQAALLAQSGLTSVREDDCGDVVFGESCRNGVWTPIEIGAITLFANAREFVQYQHDHKHKWYVRIWRRLFSKP